MKAVIYCRFSPRPNAKDCDSVEHQRMRCQAYCTAMGWEILREFSEPDTSGRSMDDRPELLAALALCCREKAVLLAYDMSRIGRDLVDMETIERRLRKAGASIAVLDQQINTTNAAGRFVFRVMAAKDQYERERVGERTSEAMRYKQRSGLRMSRHLPFGFVVDPDDLRKMVPSEDEQAAINQMKMLRGDGFSFGGIARHLDGCLRHNRGRRWHAETVRRILEREAVKAT